MKTADLRARYVAFFKGKGHVVFPSDTLVPDDPTVLFTSAGMNQFKPYFLGEKKDLTRTTSSQKCLRTGDLERVGKTACHHTFFEMLGNFSFGDYFKKETIEYAWEFLLQDLNLQEHDLWVSVYRDDPEAYALWKEHIGVPEAKIVKLGEDDNFWPANAPSLGPNGPCGPCSEIFFDRGVSVGCGKKSCSPACSCGRFVEVWNLVFTQFNRVAVNQLEPLPQKNIDTGMGLERMAAVLQGKESNFEIDILQPAVERIVDVLRVKALDDSVKGLVYAIVDHARAATFSISDGVFPSNEERGYVVRKIIRKALWQGTLLGATKPFLYQMPEVYAQLMKDQYPEIETKQSDLSKVIRAEEEKFLLTLKEGRSQFAGIIKEAKRQGNSAVEAHDLFRLYDTYGFPLELSKEMASAEEISVDEAGFQKLLSVQREQSRKTSMFDEEIFKKGGLTLTEKTLFLGYEQTQAKSAVVRLFKDSQEVDTLGAGDSGLIVLEKTPFYPEGGGQLTDQGTIEGMNGFMRVEYVYKVNDAIVHAGVMSKGSLSQGEVTATIDVARRSGLKRAHTATHLLQAALRKVLGGHVAQQGSLVDVDRFRFDFAHFQGLTSEESARVEGEVNAAIVAAEPVCKEVVSFDEAKKHGALAFFKEKYRDQVRVVSVGEYSKELCGGTHVTNTSEVGMFVILAESSISSGVRRIEALTGKEAYAFFVRMREEIEAASHVLKCKPHDIQGALKRTVEEAKGAGDRIRGLEQSLMAATIDEVLAGVQHIGGVPCLVKYFTDKDAASLLYLCDMIKHRSETMLIFLVSAVKDKNIFLCAVTSDLTKKGITCKKIIGACRDTLGLKGGGRDDMAQGMIAKAGASSVNTIVQSLETYLTT